MPQYNIPSSIYAPTEVLRGMTPWVQMGFQNKKQKALEKAIQAGKYRDVGIDPSRKDAQDKYQELMKKKQAREALGNRLDNLSQLITTTDGLTKMSQKQRKTQNPASVAYADKLDTQIAKSWNEYNRINGIKRMIDPTELQNKNDSALILQAINYEAAEKVLADVRENPTIKGISQGKRVVNLFAEKFGKDAAENLRKDIGVTETELYKKKTAEKKAETQKDKEAQVSVSAKETRSQNFIKNYGPTRDKFDRIIEIRPEQRIPRLAGWFRTRELEEKKGMFNTNELNQIEQSIMTGLRMSPEIQDSVILLRNQGATVAELRELMKEYLKGK